MSGRDYLPPGQHTITDFRPEQDNVELSMPQQNVPLSKQTMPQPNTRTSQKPMPQQQYMLGGQAMPPRQQYVQKMPGMSAGNIERPMGGQTPSQFVNLQLQPWTTGLFDCANDLDNCLITTFCPCITFGQIADLTDRGMTTCTSAGLIYGLLLYFTGCHWIYSWMYRTRMRQAYSLPEDPCHDCLVHFCCDPCALCQEYRELKNRGYNMNLGWIGNMQLKAQQEAAACVPPPVQGMIW